MPAPFKKRLVFFSFILMLPLLASSQNTGELKKDTSVHARIERIEKGLYPIYTVRGQEKPLSIEEMMKKSNVAGLSIAFVDNGKIAWTRCYGYADLEDSISVTPKTIFRAASLSKPLTAMAALHYVEEGKLDLNADINQKLKGWKLPDNEFTKDRKVTVEDIIGHRSGIKNEIHDVIAQGEYLPTLEEIFSGKTSYPPAQVISVPGEKYKYSNMGYMVLAELLADISNQDFTTLMNEVILKPCKMKSSTFDQDLPPAFKSRIATAHYEQLHEIPFYRHSSYGAGGLWTTPTDLARFLGELMNTYHGNKKSGKIISHEMAKRVFGFADEKMGFNKNISGDHLVFRNDGSIPGYNCIMMGSPAKNQAVVIMLNTGSDEAYDFINYLWRSVSMEYEWVLFEPEFYDAAQLSREEMVKFEGIYSNEKDTVTIGFHNDQLQITSTETGTQPLVPISNRAFIQPDIPLKLGFELDASGAVINLFIRDAGGNRRQPYTRIG